jgi:hypothetical protein
VTRSSRACWIEGSLERAGVADRLVPEPAEEAPPESGPVDVSPRPDDDHDGGDDGTAAARPAGEVVLF